MFNNRIEFIQKAIIWETDCFTIRKFSKIIFLFGKEKCGCGYCYDYKWEWKLSLNCVVEQR